MEIVTFANFLAIIIAIIGRFTKHPKGALLVSTIFLVCFYGIRTDYGNDIPMYMKGFEELSKFNISEAFSIEHIWEPGWLVLNVLFAPLGWQSFIFFLTAIQFFTVYWFITKYVNEKYYWLIFAFYILSAGLLLTALSMLRQALATHIVVWSVPFILKKSYIKSALLLLLASTIHTSAYASFLLLLIPILTNLNIKFLTYGFLILFSIFILTDSLIGNTLYYIFQMEELEKYEIYAGETMESGSGLGVVLKCLTVYVLLMYHSKNKTNRFFSLAYCFFVLTIPFSYTIQLIARVGIYFNFISLISFQYLTNFKKDTLGFVILILTLLIATMGYFAFFESPVWHNAFSVYSTIFD